MFFTIIVNLSVKNVKYYNVFIVSVVGEAQLGEVPLLFESGWETVTPGLAMPAASSGSHSKSPRLTVHGPWCFSPPTRPSDSLRYRLPDPSSAG